MPAKTSPSDFMMRQAWMRDEGTRQAEPLSIAIDQRSDERSANRSPHGHRSAPYSGSSRPKLVWGVGVGGDPSAASAVESYQDIPPEARADLMTVLARSIPDTNNFSGLSMFLCEKPRGLLRKTQHGG
jgi:hypothetical protein